MTTEFTNKLVYIPGKSNVVADALSRLECSKITVFSEEDLAIAQKNSELELQKMFEGSDAETLMLTLASGNKLLCFSQKGKVRPVVPESCRKAVFDLVHSLCHPSVRESRRQVAARYYWPNMNHDVAVFARKCTDCQASKIHRHIKIAPKPIEIPSDRFKHLNIDLVGPLPVSKTGYRYILTVIDRFSRYPEAFPIMDITAETVANTLFREWFTRYGIPEQVYTDQGVQFESSLFQNLCEILGVKLVTTTPYNPRANGMIERFHRTMKAALMARGNDWYEDLPFVMLGIRTTQKEDLKCSPAEMVFGTKLRLPADIAGEDDETITQEDFLKKLKEKCAAQVPTPTRTIAKPVNYIPKHLKDATHVWLKVANPTTLKRPYQGPFPVIEWREKTVVIKHANGPKEYGLERIRPADLPLNVKFNIPRGRGRPRKSPT